jgi:hypothetical protein
MHEVGHSFGFRHSGVGESEYSDESGYMGYAVNEFGYPRKAFNPHKHWLSGWFADRAIELNPATQGPVGVNLVTFVDYGNPNMAQEDVVLIRIGSLFVQYSKAKGYNQDLSFEYQDKVIVTQALGDEEISDLKAVLSKGESFVYWDEISAEGLVIEVCDIGEMPFDYAALSIHLDDGSPSACVQGLNADAAVPESFPQGDQIAGTNYDGQEIDEDTESETTSNKKDAIVLAIVWCIVGGLVVFACALLYRVFVLRRNRPSEKNEKKQLDSKETGSFSDNDSVASSLYTTNASDAASSPPRRGNNAASKQEEQASKGAYSAGAPQEEEQVPPRQAKNKSTKPKRENKANVAPATRAEKQKNKKVIVAVISRDPPQNSSEAKVEEAPGKSSRRSNKPEPRDRPTKGSI